MDLLLLLNCLADLSFSNLEKVFASRNSSGVCLVAEACSVWPAAVLGQEV